MKAAFLTAIENALPSAAWLTGPDAAPYLVDWTGEFHGDALGVARPSNVKETAFIVTLAKAHDVEIVPQGGNTGLVGGATPTMSEPAIVVQMGRMKRIRSLDPRDNSAVVEAGCVLSDLQNAALDVDRMFPLTLGSGGTAQIGGLMATNAGGTMALRWGSMRDLILGVEAVLPDGRIVHDLNTLRKRNIGIDHKHLLIGAEGTTGIITAASLKLVQKPAAHATAFVALSTLDAAPALLALVQRISGGQTDAAELVPKQGIRFALDHVAGTSSPMDPIPDWSVLLELSGPRVDRLEEDLMQVLEEAMERELIVDGVVASSEAQRNGLWFLREAIVEGQRLAGRQLKHDVAVPIARVPEFVTTATRDVTAVNADILISPFGHLGDGNIHFNLTIPTKSNPDTLSRRVYEAALYCGGTISAEHGLGRKKVSLARELGDLGHWPDNWLSKYPLQGRLNPF